MKKYLYCALMFVVAGMFTACGDDNDGARISSNPEKEVAGVYSGVWTAKVVQTTSVPGSPSVEEVLFDDQEKGTITLEESEKSFVAKIKFDSNRAIKEMMGENVSGLINVTQIPSGYSLFNFSSIKNAEDGIISDGYGATIDENGVVEIKEFKRNDSKQEEVIIGYKKPGKTPIYATAEIKKEFVYSFVGKKIVEE